MTQMYEKFFVILMNSELKIVKKSLFLIWRKYSAQMPSIEDNKKWRGQKSGPFFILMTW